MSKKRNSLIELLRFIFSMNVVKNHGFFPYQGGLFSPGQISVEFFFVLSGFLFASSIQKYNDRSTIKDVYNLYKDKIIGLGLPLLIGLAFNLCYNIVSHPAPFGIMGYLWYVHDMLIVFAVFLVLRKLIKSDDVFWGVIAIVAIITSVIHANEFFYSWGYFRAFPAIAIGMLVSKIPALKNKTVVWVGFILSSLAVLRMLLFQFNSAEDEMLNIIVYPALVYFAFQIDCSDKVFDYLGSLSFGLYAFQSIPRFLEKLGYDNVWISFIIIVASSIIADLVKRISKHFKAKKTTSLMQNP